MNTEAADTMSAQKELRTVAADAAAPSAPQLLVLAAESESLLDQATVELRELLSKDSVDLRAAAGTLQSDSRDLICRRMLVCADRADAVTVLTERNPNRLLSNRVDQGQRPAVFLLPGVGDQYVGMGYGLYKAWPVFRDAVDRCARILEPFLGSDIREVLYPASESWKNVALAKGIDLKRMLGRSADDPPDPDTIRLNTTKFAQPALFTIEYAIARLWRSLGIAPDALVGHSMGEYVAATLAGVFSLEDALRLIAARARLVNELPQATMLAVMLSEDELRPILPHGLSISLINGPTHCVVAGIPSDVSAFEETLRSRDIIARRVQNGHAFHSRMMDPILPAFEAEVRDIRLNAPQIPYTSNVTGDWIKASQAQDPGYWVKHTGETARFSDALGKLWRLDKPVLIECGPGKTLNVLAAQHPDRKATLKAAIWSMRQRYENEHDEQALVAAVGKVWLTGHAVQWDRMPGELRRLDSVQVQPQESARRDCSEGATKATAVSVPPVAANETPARGAPTIEDDRPSNERERDLVAIWKEALGRAYVGVNQSFGALGGDSLSSVGAILEMKRAGVPDEIARGLYRGLTIRQMAQLEKAGGSAPQGRRIELSSVDTPILVRAIAIYLVVASHFDLTTLGGNWALMIVSGLNFSKFQLHAIESDGSVKPVFRLMLKLAIPSFLLTAVAQMWDHMVHGSAINVASLLLVDNLTDPRPFKGGESPWFVDLLLQCWLVMAILLSTRAVRQFAIRKAYLFGLIFLAASWIVSVIAPPIFDPSKTWRSVPHMYLWLMAIGWCAAHARSDRERIITSVALVGLSAINVYFDVGQDPHVWFTVPAGLAIIWLDEFPAQLPRPFIQAIIGAAGASLFIYMTHGYFDHGLRLIWTSCPGIVRVAWSLFGGFVVWKLWNQVTRIVVDNFRKLGFGNTDLRVSAADG